MDSDFTKVRVYGTLVHCIKDTEAEHLHWQQVQTRLSQLRHFVENVEANRYEMQEPGSLPRVEITTKLRGDVLHAIQYAHGIRWELLQMLEIRRIPWADWMVSVQFLIDMYSQCRIDRGRNETCHETWSSSSLRR